MKKLLLGLAVAATALSASAQSAQWAVVGAYSDPAWNFDASVKFEAKGDGLYECTVDKLTSGFKIVDVNVSDWSVQYGTSNNQLLTVGEEFFMDAKTPEFEPQNIEYDNLVSVVNNAKVVFDENVGSLTITGDAVASYPELYVVGAMCNNWAEPGADGSVKLENQGPIYTATVNFGEASEDAPVGFKIAGLGWSPQFCGCEETISAADKSYQLNRGGEDLVATISGEQTVIFNIETMVLTIGEDTGVEAVEAAEEVAPVYYNLQGVKVANPENGIYVVVRGSKVSKEVVK